MLNGGIGHDDSLHYLWKKIQDTMEEVPFAPMRKMCSGIWVEMARMNGPNTDQEFAVRSKPNKPCPWCSTAWTQVGKPCKHLYRRLRWERMGQPKDCTVGERPNRSGTHFATQEEGTYHTPLPTFFDIDGSFITSTDRVAYRHYTRRLLRQKS